MSVNRADRDSVISASMRKFLREERLMIARIDAFRGIPSDKKKRKDSQKRARK